MGIDALEKVEVTPIVKKMVEFCLRWFGHMWRSPVETPARRVDHMEDSPIARGRGRPRKAKGKTIKKDLYFNGLTIDMVYDKILCRLIYVADRA